MSRADDAAPTGPAAFEKAISADKTVAQFDEDEMTPLRRLQHFLHAHPTGIPAIVLVLAIILFWGIAGQKFVHPINLGLILQQVTNGIAVRMAALDYVEGVYNVQPERIQRSVHPNLEKRGFHRKEAAAPYTEGRMTFDQLVNLAKTWNREGKRDTSIKKVEVLDVLDQTAVAKVTASWGVDFMLLAKFDGAWKITQILWQSPPPATAAR